MNRRDGTIVNLSGIKKQREFWLDMLKDIEKEKILQYYPKPTVEGDITFEMDWTLDREISVPLIQLSKNSDILLNLILLSCLICLLHKYSGKNDIWVAIPPYIEPDEEHALNDLVVFRKIITKAEGNSFRDFLMGVKELYVNISENQDYPLENIINELELPGELLFDIILVNDNLHNSGDLANKDYSLLIRFSRENENIEFKFKYRQSCYNTTDIQLLTRCLEQILLDVIGDLSQPLLDISLISSQEREKILFEFNQTEREYSGDKTIVELFEEQVEKSPYRTALAEADHCIDYSQLNKKANQMAHVFRKKGAKSGTLIALIVDRSIEVVMAILGILKTGAAYLPIDAETPKNRFYAILHDSQPQFLLVKQGVLHLFSYTRMQELEAERSKVHLTSPRPPIEDLDNIPIPNRSLLNYDKYNQHIGQAMAKGCVSLMATRGCPYKCRYCHKIWPKKHFYRSAENIFDEVNTYYKMGVRRFDFVDDIFNLNVKNSQRFFELVIKNKLDIQIFFPNGMRGDILTKDYIDLFVEAGTVDLNMALETASPRLQQMIKKNLDVDKLFDNLSYLCETYPQVIKNLGIMLGFPTETEEEALMTLDFVKSLKWLHFPYLNILKIYPNTDMEQLALDNGVSREDIKNSMDLAFHEIPHTLPFDKEFVAKFQSDFFTNYFLCKERLLHVLPNQMKVLTLDDIIQKYNSYIPYKVSTFEDLLEKFHITKAELGEINFCNKEDVIPTDFNRKLKEHFPKVEPDKNALRVLLLDLSNFFSKMSEQRHANLSVNFEVFHTPLGLMYLEASLKKELGSQVEVKIFKSQVDFDSYEELKKIIDEFNPNLIGLRTLSYYKDFFHQTAAMIKQWQEDVPIISGGPYASSNYNEILQDKNVDLIVIGEGEVTFVELIKQVLASNNRLPAENVLRDIAGLAFIPQKENKKSAREVMTFEALESLLNEKPASNPGIKTRPSDPIYTIYTSGSTGIPKGVLVENSSVVNLVFSQKQEFGLNEDDKILQFSSLCFDASVEQVFCALTAGAALVLVDKEFLVDKNKLEKFILEKGITHLHAVPAFLSSIDVINKSHLKRVISGADTCPVDLAKKWYEACDFYNEYGPTETTVTALEFLAKKSMNSSIRIPIGKPIANTSAYILDKWISPVPIGLIGELFVGGAGVAIGYLNNPEKTADSFSDDPFKKGKRIYRTGDLARWLHDGNIEFLGRADTQVKIRGFRIEIEEIERRLTEMESIKEAVTIAREDETGEKYLCSYIVQNDEQKPRNTEAGVLDIRAIRKKLAENLPDYMIPAYFIQLDELPLNQNGKLDRWELPEPKGRIDSDYTAPRNDIEKKLVKIWSDVLGIEKQLIGIDANFFELGGHSLKIAQIAPMISKEFKVEVSFGQIYEKPTIREISGEVLGKMMNDKLSHDLILLGPLKEKKIFCFPPMIAYGFCYEGFCKYLNKHAIYSFNYIPENDDLNKFVDKMIAVQTEGPYILVGYSGGCMLAFNVAKKMEMLNYVVSDIILIDSVFSIEEPEFSLEELLNSSWLENTLRKAGKIGLQFMQDEIKGKIVSYYVYLANVAPLGKINSNIHLILGEGRKGRKQCQSIPWENLTDKTVIKYQGSGAHDQMVDNPHLNKNAKIIKKILQ